LAGTIVAFLVFAVLGVVGWEYIRGAWESKRHAYLWIRDHVRWWGL
jgi:TRAP-type C4-dicarboxylate transport system permease small subunit